MSSISAIIAAIMAMISSLIPGAPQLPAVPAPAPAPSIHQPAPAPQHGPTISREQAMNIAVTHAGVPRNQIRIDDWELDSDDGHLSWEIEFKYGNWEYEYDIDAHTGAILSFERDWDD